MIRLSIIPNDSNIAELVGALDASGGGDFKSLERALSAIAGSVRNQWQQKVGAKYRIQQKKETKFSHVVFSHDQMVHWLEKGLEPYDMKKTHTKGKKSRVVKPRKVHGKLIFSWKKKRKNGSWYRVNAGDPYLIIPFRHRTKDKATKGNTVKLGNVYKEVRHAMKQEGFARSMVTESPATSNKVSPNYWGESIKRAQYIWGTRLKFEDKSEYQNLQGLVVMGEPKQSQFMTFRVVSVNSEPGAWMHPGIKARRYLENILQESQDQMEDIVSAALAQDVGV